MAICLKYLPKMGEQLENGNTLDLENVNGEILAVGKVKINISSDNAIYNYSNHSLNFITMST